MYTKKLLYSSILFCCFNLIFSQNLKLDEIINLSDKSLSNLQEYLQNNDFLFYKASSDELMNTDTIMFINHQNIIVGHISQKRRSTIFVENITEENFDPIQLELQKSNFSLVETNVKSNNILENKYILKKTNVIIDVHIKSDVNQANHLKNTYTIIVSKDSKSRFKYRKHHT